MARAFSAAGSQYLSTTQSPVQSHPLTIVCWVRTANVVANPTQALVAAGRVNTNNRHSLQLVNNASAAQAVSRQDLNAGVAAQTANNVVAQGVWTHVAATFESPTLRQVWAGGVVGGTNTTAATPSGPFDYVAIGSRYNPTLGAYANGDIADVGIWNVVLTADEIAALARGVTCDQIRPQSLVFYAPLIRDLVDVRGGLTITNNNGVTVSDHTRVYA